MDRVSTDAWTRRAAAKSSNYEPMGVRIVSEHIIIEQTFTERKQLLNDQIWATDSQTHSGCLDQCRPRLLVAFSECATAQRTCSTGQHPHIDMLGSLAICDG